MARRPGQRSQIPPLDRARTMTDMQTFDFVVIGAGPAGEATAHKARALGASVAIIDRRWFGGSCPHIGCVPSKALLHAAERHASGADYPWPRASARRDYMVNRAPDAADPDDTSHVKALESDGAIVYRGEGRIVGRGRVAVTHDGVSHEIAGRNVVVAVGSSSKVPPIEGLADAHPWSNREATLTRELPRSLLVLGGGPTGCELAQVYARFGVPTTIVQSGPRLVPTDHPRNSEAIRFALERDGVTVRTGVRAIRAHAGAGSDGAHVIDLNDGSTADGHAILLAVGRQFPLADLGLERYGVAVSGPDAYRRDGRLRLADGLWMAGDPAGPELHTHQAHYQGELVVRMALGEDARARLPRAAARNLHGSRGGLGGPDARPGHGARAWTPSSARPTSRDRRRDTRSRQRRGTSPSRWTAAPASWSEPRWPARTHRRRSTSACSRSRREPRSICWPRRSTRSRRPRGSSTGCLRRRWPGSMPADTRRTCRYVVLVARLASRGRGAGRGAAAR